MNKHVRIDIDVIAREIVSAFQRRDRLHVSAIHQYVGDVRVCDGARAVMHGTDLTRRQRS